MALEYRSQMLVSCLPVIVLFINTIIGIALIHS